MRSFQLLFGFTLLFGFGTFTAADDATPQTNRISQTFADIQQRVSYRDKDTDAIISVKAHDDDAVQADLQFALTEDPKTHDAIVQLIYSDMTHNEVVEEYRLHFDDALRHEQQNEQRLAELTANRRRKFEAEAERDSLKWPVDNCSQG